MKDEKQGEEKPKTEDEQTGAVDASHVVKRDASRKGESEDVVEPENALPEVTLAEVPESLRQAVGRLGWPGLLPVQAKAIPYQLARRDLMVQSRTGSGKTGAFLLPLLERVDPGQSACQVLCLVPTRELAQQVSKEAAVIFRDTGIRSIAVYGGTGYGPQLEAFRKGAHVVVGTPGRILDHLLRGSLRLERVRILIFDEADRMLSMGFYPDMKRIQEFLPRRTMNGYMFSATFPPHVLGLADEFLDRPEILSLSRDRVHVTETDHSWVEVDPMRRDRALVRLIELENPASAIVFCNKIVDAHYLSLSLIHI